MKRKLLLALIALTCALCLVFSLAGCNPAANQSGAQQETPGGQGSGSSDSEDNPGGQGGEQGGNSDEHVHNYGELIPEQPATCKKEGLQAHYYCEGCEKYFDSEKHETTLEQLKIGIDPNAHNYKFKCSQTEHWQACTDCGKEKDRSVHAVSDGVCPACGYVEKCTEGLKFGGTANINRGKVGYGVSIGTATDSHIFIPSFYNNLPVISIDDYAFEGCTSLTEITIPASVTSIGAYAFKNCTNLKGVYINDIAAWCNIDFSNIDANPLSYAHNLYLKGQLVKNLDIPNGVTAIKDYAFYNCTSLTEITIPDSVTYIGAQVFYDCINLTKISIPDSVTSIGIEAFYDTAYYNDDANWVNDVLYINNCLIVARNKLSDSYQIAPGTKLIADGAFSDCKILTEITIPNSVTSIGDWAFSDCTSLTEITIPASVTSIGSSAFEGCKSLNEITIPASVNYIGSRAFNNTAYYNDVTNWKNDVLYIENYLMKAKDTLAWGSYQITPGTKLIADWAFCDCAITEITIPDSVTYIGERAFLDCKSLTEITIPDSVTYIGERAFSGCTITEITIPDSVTYIGQETFYDCTNLESITVDKGNNVYRSEGNCIIEKETKTVIAGCKNSEIPKDVTSIGSGAFFGCESLKEITIPDSVTSIGYQAFCNCTSLTKITIGNSVTTIGEDAFGYCTSLTSITIPDSVTYIGEDAFSRCAFTEITIGNGVTYIGEDAFSRCENLERVNFSDNSQLVYIGRNAFQGCKSLNEITIPDSVTSIGSSAFEGCKSLTEITIPNSVTYIGYRAFAFCTSLERVIFENTEGWKVYMSNSKGINVNDPEQNAENLKDKYSKYYWKRGE